MYVYVCVYIYICIYIYIYIRTCTYPGMLTRRGVDKDEERALIERKKRKKKMFFYEYVPQTMHLRANASTCTAYIHTYMHTDR
jgi:hypothetical protein